MDYIFNRTGKKVQYNLNECEETLGNLIGQNRIIINRLHPEEKTSYDSNADFLFTVIYEESD